MSSKNDIDSIINNLSQNNYTFDENLLVKDEIELLKNRARDSRAIYGLNTPIGTNIFSFLENCNSILLIGVVHSFILQNPLKGLSIQQLIFSKKQSILNFGIKF